MRSPRLIVEADAGSLTGSQKTVEDDPALPPACFHCGTPCAGSDQPWSHQDKVFCCRGCLTVFELLTENGLTDFYRFEGTAGVRMQAPAPESQFRYLDEPAIRDRLADFRDDRITRITFRVPSIHCIACVWLLENLFRLQPGLGESRVNFTRKEVSITFDHRQVKLSQVAGLLASLGYEPELKLSDLEARPTNPVARRLWLQLGVAGFAFGNVMLFSVSSYLGLDRFSGPSFQKLFGHLSLLLALPVIIFSASDYWRTMLVSLRQRLLTIEVPIGLGIAALAGQSFFEVITGRGDGYFDSLTGLVFFLLCGKLFQQKTYDRLAFDRDYKSFFPLSVTRKIDGGEARVSLSQLQVGDRLILRHGELIPADARLIEGAAFIDYSFVTGESEPVERSPGDYLYAGGRQRGGVVEVETVKAVSQSYLTSLWNQEAFRKEREHERTLHSLTNRYSRYFTQSILVIALGAALFWWLEEPGRALTAFTSVLIVACPCALALAAPFALGTAQRVLARAQVFLKNPQILETLARTNAVVFDKTGTLTAAEASAVSFHGSPLSEAEQGWLYSMTRHSTHPYAVRIGESLAARAFPESVGSFVETPGRGMEGQVAGRELWMGSADWFRFRGLSVPDPDLSAGGIVQIAIDGKLRGFYRISNALRPQAEHLLQHLGHRCELALVSGDNEKEAARFRSLFGSRASLHFHQSPLDKLNFVRRWQDAGRTVMMVGDGLNDAGALRQSDIGVAVVEDIHAFSPASDVILAANRIPDLEGILSFSRATVWVVRTSILISAIYNVAGVAIAASGRLSPVVCAILMPLSSITVVAFASGLAGWLGRRAGFRVSEESKEAA